MTAAAAVSGTFGFGFQIDYAAQLHETAAGGQGAVANDAHRQTPSSSLPASAGGLLRRKRVSFYVAAGAGIGSFGAYAGVRFRRHRLPSHAAVESARRRQGFRDEIGARRLQRPPSRVFHGWHRLPWCPGPRSRRPAHQSAGLQFKQMESIWHRSESSERIPLCASNGVKSEFETGEPRGDLLFRAVDSSTEPGARCAWDSRYQLIVGPDPVGDVGLIAKRIREPPTDLHERGD